MRNGARLSALLIAAFAVLATARAAPAPDSIPLEFIDGLPFVDVAIGATHARLLFDSGGPLGISIPSSTIAAAGSVTVLEHKSKFKDLQGRLYEVPDVLAARVVVGHTALADVPGREHVQWGGAGAGADTPLTRARTAGAIGASAFGNLPLLFDYRRGTLAIYAAGAGPRAGDAGWQALALDYGKEGPSVRLRVGDRLLRFVVDTGSQVDLVDPARLPAAPCSIVGAAVAACDPRTAPDVRSEDGQALGPMTFERIALHGAPFDGVLGTPFFAHHRVLLDVAAHRLLVAPADAVE